MRMRIRNLWCVALSLASIGCVGIYEIPSGGDPDPVNNSVYVNTYVSVPYAIKQLLAPYVQGYFSPRLHRYGEYLYPSTIPYDPYDLPCYVRADFNGDGLYDYAFLFSMEEWDSHYWYVTTRLIVVLSTPRGYRISCDINLGTVYASNCVPVEEFWSICFVPAGYHRLVYWVNGVQFTKTVFLPNEAIFLASLDPADEAIFYAAGDTVYEIEWEEERLEKRNVNDGERTREKRLFENKSERRVRTALERIEQ